MALLSMEEEDIGMQDGANLLCTVGREGTSFPVTVVSSPQAMQKGLSGRSSLPKGDGMLFCFRDQVVQSMWMPDMHFPLDIVWISDTFTILHVNYNATPCPSKEPSQCPHYSSEYPALFAIEVNAGDAAALGLQVGEHISFSGINEKRKDRATGLAPRAFHRGY